MQAFEMDQVPPVTFGVGALRQARRIVAELGGGPVLLVADSILDELGTLEPLTRGLKAQGLGYELAAEVAGEPKESLVDSLTSRARALGAKLIVGIGGGAAMDAAKLVAALTPSGRAARDFALGRQVLPPNRLPALAIPTTAGTGSEVTRTAIVSTDKGAKYWYWGETLAFSHALLDPELTLSLPPHLTAWTGIDAVAHALEASTACSTHAAGLLYGLEALRILAAYLPRAVAEGADLEARAQVLWASTVAGLALHNCNTHMGHNMSHAMGSLARVHHGLITGLALEVSLPWLVAQPQGSDNYARAAQALGGPAQAEALPEAFAALMRACGIPAALPQACRDVSAVDLAASMKSTANLGMSQNAACKVGLEDLDALAARLVGLPFAPTP